jgi:type II secretory ATPase GspE/PulE/Tfp pilus assembly ATPase PilB-like protein
MINTVTFFPEEKTRSMCREISSYQKLPLGNDQFSLAFAERYQAVKLRQEGNRIWIGQVEENRSRLFWERFFPGCDIHTVKIDSDDLSSYLRRNTGLSVPGGESPGTAAADGPIVPPAALQAAAVNLVNGWILQAIRKGASDIHVETGAPSGVVRYRKDGILQHHEIVPGPDIIRACNRIKVLAGMDLLEGRLPQEGRFSFTLGGHHRDIRVSAIASPVGQSVVLRILGEEGDPWTLQDLGFHPEAERILWNAVKLRGGLFLITGPTGSGKTTTLHSLLAALPREELKIISLEDPVERVLKGIVQIQVNPSIGLTFSSLLSRVLRQDPDVIMVGEIRDEETARLAVRAAMTGHLVLASLHAGNVNEVPRRMVDLGVPPYLIPTVLKGVLSQRLVRRICPDCGISSSGDATGSRFCSRCEGSGYAGRIALGEAVLGLSRGTSAVRKDDFDSWYNRWRIQDRVTLEEAAGILVAAGITTREEIVRGGIM